MTFPRNIVRALSLLSLFPAAVCISLAQTITLSPPLEGVPGRDYMIVNHVDHDTSAGSIIDYMCGMRTYDGHQGTDFVLPSFREMDAGVWAVAAAPGRVFTVVDTAFDRNKRSVPERGFGNYVGIAHPGGIYTYYAHLRRGSVVVSMGDSVETGARLGYVGSSGNSTDPHVHFEVWNDSAVIDPFAGPCGPEVSMWSAGMRPGHDSTFTDFGGGLLAWDHPLEQDATIDTLRERPPSRAGFMRGRDDRIMCWRHVSYLWAGDTVSTVWLDSSGAVWFRYDYVVAQDVRYFYFWTYISTPPAGNWSVRQSMPGLDVQHEFTVVENSSGARGDDVRNPVAVRYDESGRRLAIHMPVPGARLRADLFAIDGRYVASLYDDAVNDAIIRIDIDAGASTSGVYFVVIHASGETVAVPVVVRK